MNIHLLKLFSSGHHVDVTQVTTGSQKKNFSPNNSSTVAMCNSSAMSVGTSLVCASVCEVDMCMYVGFLPSFLCSLIKSPVEATCFSKGSHENSNSLCMHLHQLLQL